MVLHQSELVVATAALPVVTRLTDGSVEFDPHPSALIAGMARFGREHEPILWLGTAETPAEQSVSRLAAGGCWSTLPIADGLAAGLDIIAVNGAEEFLGAALELVRDVILPVLHSVAERDKADDVTVPTGWIEYQRLNEEYAAAIDRVAAQGATVFINDHVLLLVPGLLESLRPDLRTAMFVNAPWAPNEQLVVLPAQVRVALLESMTSAERVVFNTRQWVDAFVGSCRAADIDVANTKIGVAPLAIDVQEILPKLRSADVMTQIDVIRRFAQGRRIIGRVDRAERASNTLRGLQAYRELLENWPEWRESVVHVATTFPGGADGLYSQYRDQISDLADSINTQFGSADWMPVHLDQDANYAASLALMHIADTFIDNSIANAMSIPVLEVAVLSDCAAPLVLSASTGVAQRFASEVITVDPFDVEGTAQGIDAALRLPADVRRSRFERLRRATSTSTPVDWFAAQIEKVRSSAQHGESAA